MSHAPGALHALLDRPLFWEDLAVGASYSTAGRTITEADVVGFAALTGDFNRVHVDAEFAKTTAFGQRIAHGLLVIAIGTGLNTRTVANQLMEPALVGLLETQLRFLRPTLLGDTIRVDVEVTGRKETRRADRGIVTFRRTTVNQRGEAVAEATVVMMVLRRPAQAGATPTTQSGGQQP